MRPDCMPGSTDSLVVVGFSVAILLGCCYLWWRQRQDRRRGSGYDLAAERWGIAANDWCVPTVPGRIRVSCR